MTKTKLVWRLANRPTPNEVADLLKQGIITKEEAREILFSEETEQERDDNSLKSEIKFLRELVERLSKNSSTVITTIREIERPYIKYPWYGPYQVWCSAQNIPATNTATAQWNLSAASAGNLSAVFNSTPGFTSIKTF